MCYSIASFALVPVPQISEAFEPVLVRYYVGEEEREHLEYLDLCVAEEAQRRWLPDEEEGETANGTRVLQVGTAAAQGGTGSVRRRGPCGGAGRGGEGHGGELGELRGWGEGALPPCIQELLSETPPQLSGTRFFCPPSPRPPHHPSRLSLPSRAPTRSSSRSAPR